MEKAGCIRLLELLSLVLVLVLLSGTAEAAEARNTSAGSGLYQRIISEQTEALTAARSEENGIAEIDALLARAEAYRGLGYLDLAAKDLELAAQLAEAATARDRLASIRGSLGALRSAQGNQAAARQELTRSIDLAREEGLPRVEAASLINLGNALAAKSDLRARAVYSEAARAAKLAAIPAMEAHALLNAARVELDDHRAAEAQALVQQAKPLVHSLPKSRERLEQMLSVSLLLYDLKKAGGDVDAVPLRDDLLNAADLANRLNERRLHSLALGTLGRLEEREGDLRQATHLTEQALLISRAAGAAELSYRWQAQLGRILRDRGDRTQAISAYESATRTLLKLQVNVQDPVQFREMVDPVFAEYAELVLTEVRQNPARKRELLTNIRQAFDRLKSAQLANYFRDQCVAELEGLVEEVDGQLGEHEAILYPIGLADRLALILSTKDEIKLVESPQRISKGDLAKLANAFRRDLEEPGDNNHERLAQQLYQLIIAPVAPDLEAHKVKTIVFIPDGELSQIPLAALHDGSQYLVERYAVSVTPGLSMLDPKPLRKTAVQALLGGLSTSVHGFDPLTHVPDELKWVREGIAGPASTLLDKDFTRSRLEATLGRDNYTIVHLASHAQFESDSDETFILLAGEKYMGTGDKVSLDDLENLISPRRFRPAPVELMTLSACQTAAGDERTAFGLAGIAVKSGARSALASLWWIDDDAAADLMRDFYAFLNKPATNKAQALQRAQINLMRIEGNQDPYYWAPFLMIGNWK